jgi:hypothetical protein
MENKPIQCSQTVLNSYRKVVETGKVGTILHTCVTTITGCHYNSIYTGTK